jgi:hypothetical protein
MAISLVATGVLILFGPRNDLSSGKNILFGPLFIGLGGYLSFTAKPQTAAALAILILIFAFIEKSFQKKLIIPAAVFSLTLLFSTIILVDGSVSVFYQRLLVSLELESLSGTHDIFKPIVIGQTAFFANLNNFIIMTFLFLSFLAFSCEKISSVNYKNNTFDTIYLNFIFLIFLLLYVLIYNKFNFYNLISGYLLLAPFAILLVESYARSKRKKRNIEKNKIILCFLFFCFPIAFTLGSNNSIFIMASLSAFFLLLAALALLSGVSDAQNYPIRVLIISSICLTVSIGIVYSSLKHPYRQPLDLSKNDALINLTEGNSPLYLSDDRAKYILDLRTAAKNFDFKKGSPIIDLSGRVPGAVFALSGYSLGYLNLSPVLLTDDKYFYKIFSSIPCEEMADSWLIYDERPLRKPIDPGVLLNSGIDLSSDQYYIVAGKATFTSDYSEKGYYQSSHLLLKPIRDHETATEACLKARSEAK